MRMREYGEREGRKTVNGKLLSKSAIRYCLLKRIGKLHSGNLSIYLPKQDLNIGRLTNVEGRNLMKPKYRQRM